MQERSTAPLEIISVPGTMINGNHVYIPAASLAMRTVERVVSDIASTSIPVLILGESGTGKEVIASQIHRLSPRREQPFTKITCASLTADFFNNRPRASLGGNGQAFEAATFWGTVLFDEIAELDMNCQARLLHALPEGEHAGASAASARGARIICTSSRNLEEELRSGRLREELYYRINGVCLRLPPLRQRRDDIPLLADFFLTKYAAIFGRTQPQLSPHVMAELCEHNWPGNVRELENVIKKVVALGDERAALSDLRAAQSELTRLTANSLSSNSLSLKDAARAASRQAEKEMILKVLSRTRWNRKRAAQELRISYKALLYKLKQIGLDDQLAR